jgi:linoleate 10R-lipoxygenase
MFGFIKSRVDKLKGKVSSLSDGSKDGNDFLEKVIVALRNKEQNSGREIAAQVFAATVPSAALYAAALSQIVNFFLQPSNVGAREKVLALSKRNFKEAGASTELMGYVRGALRLNPAVLGFYRTAGREIDIDSRTI